MSKSRRELPALSKSPSVGRIDAQALRRQQIAFCVLTAFLLAALLLLHSHFSFLLGEPSEGVIVILAFAFGVEVLEWLWLWSQRSGITERTARIATANLPLFEAPPQAVPTPPPLRRPVRTTLVSVPGAPARE